MNVESAVNRNKENERRLKSLEKYQVSGVDIAFRCDRCSKLVLQQDILYGVMCRKCGTRRVYPITQDLTWFGVHYCRFWNWVWKQYYVRKFNTKTK